MRTRGMVLPLAVAASMSLSGTASAAFLHSVAPGESLSSVAATDGLTVEQLAAANDLSPTTELIAGSQLVIPPQGDGVVETSSSAGSSETVAIGEGNTQAGEYVVQPGDTLTAIAERAGTTVEQLATANGLNLNDLLLSGTTITLGDTAGNPSYPTNPSAATSQPVGEAATGSPGGPPYPTQQTVSPSQVEAIASADGVPTSLANAIAYMESGFNNEFVSSANARGVMQITPGTWDWIDQELAGSAPLSPESATENVRAGVLLLHSLLEATGGNEALAAAGYYQGLPSVLENGMYPSTQQYVSDVEALQQRFGGG